MYDKSRGRKRREEVRGRGRKLSSLNRDLHDLHDLHENKRLTREEMDQQEHRSKNESDEVRDRFLGNKREDVSNVGCSLSGFLSSADFLINTERNRVGLEDLSRREI